MKKLLLLILLGTIAMNIWADNIIFQNQHDAEGGVEYQVPITGNVNGNDLNLYYKGTDIANVSVKDKNGSIVYQNSINGKNTINLSGYAQGDYTVKVEDTKGNSAVAQFQVTK